MRKSVKVHAVNRSAGHITANDVGIQSAVSIASLDGTSWVWRSNQAIVDDAAVTRIG